MSLKQKTISGFTWSFIEVVSKQGVVFIIGIILARLLTPREFGLIGMTTIFMAFSQSFIDSGFGQALVRKQNCSQADFSTVFYFNLLVGFIMAGVLFFAAGYIAVFFNETKLKLIVQVISIGLIIQSFSVIQFVLLIKEIDFKTQTKISVISSLSAGAIGIYMAYNDFGVWSLVAKYLAGLTFTTILLWFWSSWKPSLTFSFKSLKELFSFGSKLLASNLINRIYENVYLLVIGKYFSAAELGYYTRANQFKDIFSKNLSVVIQRVSYPALASIQDETIKLKEYYRILIKSSMFIVFIIGIGIIIMAEPLILLLIVEKCLTSVLFLQLLSVAGIFYPLQEINKNMLKVIGRTDIILYIEIVIKIIVVPVIIVGIYLGIEELIYGIIFISIVSFLVNSYFAGKRINYLLFQQIHDISGAFIICFIAGILSFLSGVFLEQSLIIKLLLQSLVYLSLIFAIAEITKKSEYVMIKKILVKKFFKVHK